MVLLFYPVLFSFLLGNKNRRAKEVSDNGQTTGGAENCAENHPEQGPWGPFGDLLYPQNPIFCTHKETCAKKWVLRAQQLPLHAWVPEDKSRNSPPQSWKYAAQLDFLAFGTFTYLPLPSGASKTLHYWAAHLG